MPYFFLLPFFIACKAGNGVALPVQAVESAKAGNTNDSGLDSTDTTTDTQNPGEPGAEPGSEPGTEPGAEPGSEPGTEPSAEPGSEPQEEADPNDFSEVVESELGLTLGSSDLQDVEGQLKLWLDASYTDSIIKDSDNRIAQWQNRHNQPDHAQQASAGQQPSYVPQANMVAFDGDHFFQVENQMVDISTTYFVVYKGNDPKGTLFAKANATGDWSQGGKTFFIRGRRYSTDVGWVGYVETSSEVSTSQASIAMFEHSNNGQLDTHQIFHNGLLTGSGMWNFDNFPESSLDAGGQFKIGYTSANFPQSHGLYGSIGEIIKIDQLLTTEQQILIHAYLAQKWSIRTEVDSDADGTPDEQDPNPLDPNQ